MSAAEMREAAARLAMSKLEAMGLRGTGHIVGEAILGLPLSDEEGMVERVARAMCFAWHYAKPRTPDGEAEWARERSRLMAQARAALHVINGGAEGGEARQHIEALLSLHIAHHNNPIHGAARAFLSKREAK